VKNSDEVDDFVIVTKTGGLLRAVAIGWSVA
jgi:hypothetical protein